MNERSVQDCRIGIERTKKSSRLNARCTVGMELLGIYVRAQIDNKTVVVGFLNRIYPRLGDPVRKLVEFFSQ